MPVKAVSPRFGYADAVNVHADTVTVVTTSAAAVNVSIVTSAATTTLQGTPSPATSYDGTYRLVDGAEAFGRGPRVVVEPQDTTTQWGLQSIALAGVTSDAIWSDA
jgi:hypothetical protein